MRLNDYDNIIEYIEALMHEAETCMAIDAHQLHDIWEYLKNLEESVASVTNGEEE